MRGASRRKVEREFVRVTRFVRRHHAAANGVALDSRKGGLDTGPFALGLHFQLAAEPARDARRPLRCVEPLPTGIQIKRPSSGGYF